MLRMCDCVSMCVCVCGGGGECIFVLVLTARHESDVCFEHMFENGLAFLALIHMSYA